MNLPGLADIHAAYLSGEKSVTEMVSGLAVIIQKQNERIKSLEDQLAKNSKNSSKPPSSEGLKKLKTVSLRKKGNNKNGGQPGHKGKTLQQVEKPDHVKKYTVCTCENCKHSLHDQSADDLIKRQVFDLPPLVLEVTEHQAEVKICPSCGTKNIASFPTDITHPTQYGNGVKSLATYLNIYQFIPLQRVQELFGDLFQQPINEATIIKANSDCTEQVVPSIEVIKQNLKNADILHCDETGLRVEGSLHWLHVAATENLTFYGIHKNRGQEAMDEIGILPELTGKAVHDHWKPYFNYPNIQHDLCNAHHLRELVFIAERYEQEWANEMIDHLLEIKKTVDQTKLNSSHLPVDLLHKFEKRYDEIVQVGLKSNPPPPQEKKKKRGRVKLTPPLNLLNRLRDFKCETLDFMHDFSVPFDNNLAERDVRMMKVKQKVSGCFRTYEGAEIFCSLRSYISTARKNSVNVLAAIKKAFDGSPFIPDSA